MTNNFIVFSVGYSFEPIIKVIYLENLSITIRTELYSSALNRLTINFIEKLMAILSFLTINCALNR